MAIGGSEARVVGHPARLGGAAVGRAPGHPGAGAVAGDLLGHLEARGRAALRRERGEADSLLRRLPVVDRGSRVKRPPGRGSWQVLVDVLVPVVCFAAWTRARHRRPAPGPAGPHAARDTRRGRREAGTHVRMVAQTRGPAAPRHGPRLGQTGAMGSAGDKPRKPRRRLAKVPKYEEPNTFPAPGLTGSAGGVYGSRYGHSADHHQAGKKPGRFGAFVLRFLGLKPKP